MASLSVRIALDPSGRIGPGKIDLLEEIAARGSISAAGRKMAMSYRRAWELVEEMNAMFVGPVVERQIGGKNGGGASLTPLGLSLVTRYRAIERAASDAARGHLDHLQSEVARSRGDETEAAEKHGATMPDQAGLRSIKSLPR